MAVCTSSVNGKGKKKFRTEQFAWAVAERQEQRFNVPFNAYFCYVCYAWHTGKAKIGQQREEILVGKLIGILRGTYKGEKF